MTIKRVYLGNPLSPFGMQPLPAIPVGSSVGGRAGMTPTLSRGTVTQILISGGAATQRHQRLKSTYPIQWVIRGPADIDLLMSFFDGGQGVGPYCLVDPSQTNYLPANVARMGAVLGAVPEWTPTVGALATSTAAGPTGLLSGVCAWTGSANASILYMGLNNVVDGTWLPPVVTGLAHRMSIWAKLASGTGTLTAAMLYGVAGSAPAGSATGTAAAVALSTSVWQEVSVAIPNTFSWPATADYAMLRLTVSSATSPSILLAAPAMVYDTVVNAAALSPWVSGVGVPRCVIVGDAPSPVGRPGMRDWTMTLQEA